MSIPKIIHYCWFGGKPKPELAQKCLKSWKKHCPDYEILEWNEDNFDVSTAPLYVRQAYEQKRWAFVSDYVRLRALTEMGGVYMDTDVEVIRSLDPFLRHKAFAGFEHPERVQTGLLACDTDVEVIKPLDPYLKHEAFAGYENETSVQTGLLACEKGFSLFRDFLAYYDTAVFIREDGTPDTTTNVFVLTEICRKHGFVPNGKYQQVQGLSIYPKEVFCPVEFDTMKLKKTRRTVTIHWFSGSWHTEAELEAMHQEKLQQKKEKMSNIRYAIGTKVFGEHGYDKLKSVLKRR